MKIVEMVMPPMGESNMECTVLHLLAEEGAKVRIDDSILEVATDKVDTEVPCPYEGTLTKWLVKVDDVVPIGSAVAQIEVADDVVAQDAGTPLLVAVEEEADAVAATAAFLIAKLFV